ncbi:MAG: iron-containing alcohol dehydrogenase [Treponema sp.]|nr:iron-containing alcohol dehydrogenase [Treponema sp.]
MNFFIPTDIYVENDCVNKHASDFARFGKRALIVTGAHSAKANGSLNDLVQALAKNDISYQLFDQVEENPSVETVAKASEVGKSFNADFVIGIGGGSPLDAAKAIALLIANPQESEQILYQKKDLGHLPVIAIPTTCGTGSEATAVSVLTNHQLGVKKSIPYKIFPALALVDGKYLSGASKSLIVNTAVDALAHLIESYLNSKSNDFNKMFPEYGFKLWAKNKEALLGEKELGMEDYQTLMLTSTIAGLSIAHTGTGVPHGMSYDLTYSFGLPHGKACGYFQAAYMEVCARHLPDQVEKLLQLLGLPDLNAFSTMIESLIGKYKLPAAALEKFAKAMESNEGKLSATPFKISKEEIWEIYEKSVGGE